MEKRIRLRIIGDPMEAQKVLRTDSLSHGETLTIGSMEKGMELADENPDLFMLDDDDSDQD